jgi:CubicO group peptidase (beta-lactamase class C family)
MRNLGYTFQMKLLFCLLLLLSHRVFSQHDPIDSLDAFISKQVCGYHVPGLSIGIIKGNKIVFQKGYGVMSAKDSAHVTASTIFPILSCSKAFTAAAIGMLVQEGKIKWDDKVVKYLPDFALSDPWITSHLTISDILSHRSGLESFEGDLLWYGTQYSRREIVRRLRYSPIKNNFRADFGYQNILYLAAGLIIEKVSGKTWDSFVQEKLFVPLHMNHTTTSIKDVDSNNLALPHLGDAPGAPVNLDNIGPAGSINSNIEDMLGWLQLWIDGGKYHGVPLLSNNTVETMTSPKTFISENGDHSYGFGWEIEWNNQHKIISHGGGMPGYKSLVTIDPASQIGIIILTNKISYINEELTSIILDYLNGVQINWRESDKNLATRNFRYPWDDNTNDAFILKAPIPDFTSYKGKYEDRQYGKVEIQMIKDTPVMKFIPVLNNYKGYLSYINNDTLHIAFSDRFISSGRIIFNRDTKNKITGFHFDIPPGDFNFNGFRFKKQ